MSNEQYKDCHIKYVQRASNDELWHVCYRREGWSRDICDRISEAEAMQLIEEMKK